MFLSIFAPLVSGHGNMVIPATWFDPEVILANPHQQCHNGACDWFTNYTFVDKPTMPFDSPMRTYAGTDPDFSDFQHNPWGAPGKAFVWSPCGVHGGNPWGCPFGNLQSKDKDCPAGGYGWGPDARTEYGTSLTDIKTTVWKSGDIVEALWAIKANHGGGYSYRLCKLPKEGVVGLTEECFQEGQMDFYGAKQWVQEGTDATKRIEFPAVRTTAGTWPPNSQWTRVPVPACLAFGGGVFTDVSDECAMLGGRTQFPPPAKGVQGFGTYFQVDGDKATLGFNIVDKLVVPNLTPGRYVLSHRWDCEQTSQVWTTCADIKIVA